MLKDFISICMVIAPAALLLAAVSGAQAKSETLFTGTDLSGWTLQPPINAVGPISANGNWTAENGALVATGTAAPWTVQTAGSPTWTDYRLSVQVTVRKPAPKVDFPIKYYEFDRYMPRDEYPPGDHTGQYRYRFYAGEFDWGSDAAVYVRYQDRTACYRVQLSTEFQEIILWHGAGGYLQVVPWKLEAGKTYRLDVSAQGSRIQVSVDGKKAIDYVHECLPTMAGGIGLAAYQATVAFQNIQVTSLPPATSANPPHRAVFSTRQWRGLRWIFDGNEPITLLHKSVSDDNYLGKMLYYQFVKLRPGYRPLYHDWVAVRRSYTHISQLIGDVDAIATKGEKSGMLTLDFDSITSDKLMRVHHTDVLTYDAVRGVYRHAVTAEINFDGDQTANLLEFSDPLTYNNKAPGKGVRYPWLYSGHDWGLVTGEDGKLYRQPISEGLWLEQQDGWRTNSNPSRWVLYPDRAVCPAWEVDIPGMRMYREICHWGYDFHQRILRQDEKDFTFKAGDKFTIKYVMTGYPPQEGEGLFREAPLHPKNDAPETSEKIPNLLLVPSAYAFAVCDPAGTTFSEMQSVRQPFIGWPFFGDYAMDREVGHTDHYSLRLDGPAAVSGEFYHHMIDSYAKQYVCTLWIKTRGVTGKAPVVTLKYSYAKEPADRIETNLYGDNDWQELTFLTTVPVPTIRTYDSSVILVEHPGQGTVWIDDFSVRPVAEGETVTEKRPVSASAAPLPAPVSPDFLIYLKGDEGQGRCCADSSGHGNTCKLFKAGWTQSGKRAVLHFEGGALGLITTLSPELQQQDSGEYGRSALTLDAWVRPTAGKPGGAIIGYMFSPILYLEAASKEQFRLRFAISAGGKNLNLTSTQLVPAGQWSHVAATVGDKGEVRLYINGKEAGKAAITGNIAYKAAWRWVVLGAYGRQYGQPYYGDMAEIRWWTREATPAEIAAAAVAAP